MHKFIFYSRGVVINQEDAKYNHPKQCLVVSPDFYGTLQIYAKDLKILFFAYPNKPNKPCCSIVQQSTVALFYYR